MRPELLCHDRENTRRAHSSIHRTPDERGIVATYSDEPLPVQFGQHLHTLWKHSVAITALVYWASAPGAVLGVGARLLIDSTMVVRMDRIAGTRRALIGAEQRAVSSRKS